MNQSLDLFEQINNAVLDLQSSDSQTFTQPLKRLGRLLRHPDLATVNADLVQGLDVDAFIAAGEATQGGMIGTAQLDWPDDDGQVLGLRLLLALKFCDDPDFMHDFAHTFYYSGNNMTRDIQAVTTQLIIPFARDYKAYVVTQGTRRMSIVLPMSNKVFIVHGHDGEAREAVARFLEKLGFEAIILHEQASRGRTVIEKVEAHSDVGFAIILLTPDDVGRAKDMTELEPRARQNVLLELGYFIGKLGRDRVLALKRGVVEIPSDFAGVVWESYEGTGWKQSLAKELEAAGHKIDWNKVMR
ncbi:nucleotide-binding protein [Parvibaculum sp.]|uniref:nucleotide-binding protein n=1 Tax=Parvibaculum sp. TaxID=2024848 RepID=UPI001D348768|nr:nucleotide-binding protein [Parvibaculum sp.]MBX3490503.1 nucleotide-binding protein [Parvibaculum sp.]